MDRLLEAAVLICAMWTVCGKNYELGLYKSLLSNETYNKLERPVEDNKQPITVKLGLVLNQIIDIEDRSEIMNLNVWLNFEWRDYRLVWNSSKNGGVTDLRVPADKLWKPDILLFNSVDSSFETIFPVNFVITSDGTVSWIPPAIVKASCKLDIRWFPFDEQKCYLKFGSWTHSGKKLDLQPNGAMDLSEYIENGEWSVIDTPILRIEKPHACFPEETYPSLYFYLYLRRRTLYFGFNLIIPGLLITLMATLGFFCPPDAGEKVALEITVLLSICFYVTTVVANIMPPTSEALPLISIYFMICLILVTVSVLFTVFVLNLRHRGALTHKMSPLTRLILLNWLPKILRMERTKESPEDEDDEEEKAKHQSALIHLRRQRFAEKNKDCQLTEMDAPIFTTDSFRKHQWEMKSGDYVERCLALLQRYSPSDTGITTLLVLIQSIFTEIKFITDRMRREEVIDDAQNEWIYAALVVDRLCLIFILALVSASTIAVIFASPHVVA